MDCGAKRELKIHKYYFIGLAIIFYFLRNPILELKIPLMPLNMHAKLNIAPIIGTLEGSEWPYDPEIEHPLEELDSRNGSHVSIFTYKIQKYKGALSIIVG